MPELTFSVDSALFSELGEKLVETPHIALVELVKNAYDADATHVHIRIIDDPPYGPEIHLADNGSGMTYGDVQRYWMRIATTNKTSQDVSPRFGRQRTGSKGIGRFSCRRLGTRLKLTTTAALNDGRFEQTEAFFDWTRFKPGKEIGSISCNGETRRLADSSAGTTLVISKSPADEWRKRGYDFLKRQLAVLTANRGRRRSGYEPDPGFTIQLDAPGFNDKIANLRDQLLTAGWGTLELKVTARGDATWTLSALNIGEKEIDYPETIPELAGTAATIGIMPAEKADLRNKEVLSLGALKKILEEWGGIYLRYKGFRVYPFGEPGNDWLNIDRDRGTRKSALSAQLQPFAARLRGVDPQRALLSLLSSKSYIGDVIIGNDAKGFEAKANREGFVGDAGISQLREGCNLSGARDWRRFSGSGRRG